LANKCTIEEFETVFRQYKDMVFKTAYLMLGNTLEAEDVLQEVFVKIHKSWDSFDPHKGKMYTWIHRITINQCISEHRRKRESSLSLERLEDQGFELSKDCSDLPEERLMKQEESERMWQTMGALDEKRRAVLVLRYYDDLSYDEIARVLNIPLGTVKSRLNTAIRNFRKELLEGGVTS